MLQYKSNLSYLQEFSVSWCLGACYFSHPPRTYNELQVNCFGSPLLKCQVPSVLFCNEQNLTGIQTWHFFMLSVQLGKQQHGPRADWQINGTRALSWQCVSLLGPETLWAISAVRLQQMSQPFSCSNPQAWLAPALSLWYLRGSNKPVQQLCRWKYTLWYISASCCYREHYSASIAQF